MGRRLLRDKVSVACALILLAIFLAALLAPYLHLADPYQGSMIRRLKPIGTPNYPLGSDELGRDMLARLIAQEADQGGWHGWAWATCDGGEQYRVFLAGRSPGFAS